MELKFIFLLFSCCSLATCALRKDAKIVVVGAGLSGVSAASKLVENGYTNVIILEAGNRMGGRIDTVPFGDNVIDLGGQWVHDGPGSILYDMIAPYGMIDVTPRFFFEGDMVSSEWEMNSDYLDAFEIYTWIFREKAGCENYWAKSYGDYFMEALNVELNRTENLHLSSQHIADSMRQYGNYIAVFFASDSMFHVSTSFCSEMGLHPGRWLLYNWKDKGFKTAFDFITKKLPDPSKDLHIESKIQLRKEVNEIDYTNADNGVVKVRCTDGSVYDADHVIVTVPLGYLKANHRTMFKPQLPLVKVNSIENIQFGVMDKIIMEFARPFWPENWGGVSLIWTEQGLRQIAGTRFEWTRGIVGIYQVSYQPNVLKAWVIGDDARHMETLTNDEILTDMMFVFQIFIGGRLHYTWPISTIVSRWATNPHFRGSYSSRTVESDLSNASAFDLSLPVNNSMGVPVVLFAGEATHPLDYSLTHGAVGSGFREADRLMNI